MSLNARRRAHIEKLAEDHDVTVNWRRRGFLRYECIIEYRAIFIGEPTGAVEYLGALHEIGHCVSKQALAARKRGHQLVEEAAAWDWAATHADPELGELTERTRNRVGAAWASYLGRLD